ncbi:alpha-L-fucosidase [Bifidobacterium hapali]|uniref:alpha-L-fucosidase n=1 Tax=Bifidobacterium hapali TaxID=1630172 RepID=A0A261G1C0_9BIFI|nr:alpha-L-fucosidase [Bifidobacterium hapali]OZG65178.1 alpha-L-fucosidase [Bifidobacterium hapali]
MANVTGANVTDDRAQQADHRDHHVPETDEEVRRDLAAIDEVIARGRFKPDWASLQQHRTPQWFEDAKFGIFIHWGVYSVPSFGSEWYSRNMYIQGSKEFEHHVKTYGPQKEFGYKDFIPMFKAEKFDPNAWADLFEEAGVRYVVPVAEHHDGFQMYKSRLSHWNAAEMGPHRDVLGELSKAFNERGLVNGASSHRVEHWFFMGHGKEFDSDIHEPLKRGDFYWPSMPEPDHMDQHSKPVPTREYLEDWLLRCCEIVDNYHPKVLYFDWWILHEAVQLYLKKFAAYYYNRADEWGEEVTICYKQDSFMFGTATPDVERGQLAETKPYHWQTDTAIALNSWGYTENNQYRPAAEILQDFVDIVSKNGNLLLNVGPKPDGTIGDEDRAVLTAIGLWLKTNGEAIYGAKPWKRFGEGPTQIIEGQFSDSVKKNFTSRDVRYTINGSNLYAIAMRPAADGVYRFERLKEGDAEHNADFHGLIDHVDVLGVVDHVEWTRDETALEVHVPVSAITGDEPVVFRVVVA